MPKMSKAEAKRKCMQANSKLSMIWTAQFKQGNLLSRSCKHKLEDAMDKILQVQEKLGK
jgi:hypothetical protein